MKEQEMFNWLKDNKYPDLEKAKSKYSRHDCYSKENNAFIELKSRNIHYDELLIEKKKYDSLLNKALQHEATPYYVCFTPEGMWSFNLHEIQKLTWEVNYKNPATTYFSNRSRVPKEVSYIPIKFGKKLL